jgi:hypothetical protein
MQFKQKKKKVEVTKPQEIQGPESRDSMFL